MSRPRLSRQCFEISLVALCSHSLSTANPMTSTAANHLGAFGAGSPNGVSLPAATKTGMSCSAKLSSFAVAATSRRAGKPLAAHAAIAACVKSSVIAHSISPGHTSSSSHRSGGARALRARASPYCELAAESHCRRAFDWAVTSVSETRFRFAGSQIEFDNITSSAECENFPTS